MAKAKKYKLSQFYSSIKISKKLTLVGHSFLGTSHVISAGSADILSKFKKPMSAETFFKKFATKDNESLELIRTAIDFFLANYLLVEANSFEERTILKKLHVSKTQTVPIARESQKYKQNAVLDISDLKVSPGFSDLGIKDLNILLMGGCIAEMAGNYLGNLGIKLGLNVNVISTWPDDLNSISKVAPDIVVFHSGMHSTMRPLWESSAILNEQERESRVGAIEAYLKDCILNILKVRSSGLFIIVGVEKPQFVPTGRSSFREANDYDQLIDRINNYLSTLIKKNPNALFVNPERIFSNLGKTQILDDLVIPYGHHGPLNACAGIEPPGLSRSASLNLLDGPRIGSLLLAEEILNSYLFWSGRGRIKCVVVDLDNTLWPGVLGEDTAILDDQDFIQTFWYGTYGGIHEALKILKNRGILLVSSSKNDHDAAMKFWKRCSERAQEFKIQHFLSPDDFVLHKINWNRKSQNISEISKALSINLNSLMFIDDHPVEREEVGLAHPTVRILGSNLFTVRSALLSDPCLQVSELTPESGNRTETTKAKIQRDDAQKLIGDESTFLRQMNIVVNITCETNEKRVSRIVELLQRTNQFNTTQKRYDSESILKMLSLKDSHYIYTMEVKDKFTEYGLVGICILDLKNRNVDVFAMSCRVLALKAAPIFLAEVLMHFGKKVSDDLKGFSGDLRVTPQNSPCHSLFLDAGFIRKNESVFSLSSVKSIHVKDANIYTILWT